nr:MAG TPA: hypothetical protein [Caudoviricetes sp.]
MFASRQEECTDSTSKTIEVSCINKKPPVQVSVVLGTCANK